MLLFTLGVSLGLLVGLVVGVVLTRAFLDAGRALTVADAEVGGRPRPVPLAAPRPPLRPAVDADPLAPGLSELPHGDARLGSTSAARGASSN